MRLLAADGGGCVLFWVLFGGSSGLLDWGFRSFVTEINGCICELGFGMMMIDDEEMNLCSHFHILFSSENQKSRSCSVQIFFSRSCSIS